MLHWLGKNSLCGPGSLWTHSTCAALACQIQWSSVPQLNLRTHLTVSYLLTLGCDSLAMLSIPVCAHCRVCGTSSGACRGTGGASGRGCRKMKCPGGPWLGEQHGFGGSAMTVICFGNWGCCFSWGWSSISCQAECPTACGPDARLKGITLLEASFFYSHLYCTGILSLLFWGIWGFVVLSNRPLCSLSLWHISLQKGLWTFLSFTEFNSPNLFPLI